MPLCQLSFLGDLVNTSSRCRTNSALVIYLSLPRSLCDIYLSLADVRLSSTPARHSVLLQQLFETCRSHYWALHPTVSLGSLRLLSAVDHRRVLLRTPTNVASFKSFELSINAIDELGLLPNVCSLGTAVTFVPPFADFKLFF